MISVVGDIYKGHIKMADVLKNLEMSMNHSNDKILAYHHGFS